jgi:predicted DNA-binding transcriptional regulator AlpA
MNGYKYAKAFALGLRAGQQQQLAAQLPPEAPDAPVGPVASNAPVAREIHPAGQAGTVLTGSAEFDRQTKQPPLTVSVEHFAAQISVSPDTAYRLVRLGLMPKLFGLGRNVRLTRQAADQWVAAAMTSHPHLRPAGPFPRLMAGEVEVLAVDCQTAAQVLGVSPSRLFDLVHEGRLPKLPHLLRLVRVPLCAVHGFWEHAARESAPPA